MSRRKGQNNFSLRALCCLNYTLINRVITHTQISLQVYGVNDKSINQPTNKHIQHRQHVYLPRPEGAYPHHHPPPFHHPQSNRNPR